MARGPRRAEKGHGGAGERRAGQLTPTLVPAVAPPGRLHGLQPSTLSGTHEEATAAAVKELAVPGGV